MKELLGSDLEILPDGDYMLLRRISSCLVPIFCLYTMVASDFSNQVVEEGINPVELQLPQKIFDEFIQHPRSSETSIDVQIACIFFQAQPFEAEIERAVSREHLLYVKRLVDYTLKGQQEYLIEPTLERNELFFKEPRYEYQHEIRRILPKFLFQESSLRFPLYI